MSPADFLAELRQRGGVLHLDGDQVRCRAPRGVMTETIVDYMRRHKTELIALLATEAALDPDGLRLRTALTLFDGEIIGDMAGDVSREVD